MSADHRRLATRLHFAAIHLLRTLRRADEALDLSPAELSAVATLVTNGPMTLTKLAEAEQVRPPTITRLTQRLEADGYLIREASPVDGRVSLVRHTTKGWTTLEAAAAGRAAALSDALDQMDQDDLATLQRAAPLLERLAGHAPPPT